jgi:hypothetical protein
MSKKTLVIMLLLVVVSILTFNRQIFSTSKSTSSQLQQVQQAQSAQPLPEHVPYMFLFHHLVFLKQKADEFERQGKGKSSLLIRFQEDAKLTDRQFQMLYQIAADCEQQVAMQDEKAMAIINTMKARYPDGKLPDGEGPPPIPPILITLQQDHNAIILRARDRLHQALGEQAFLQFHAFVQSRIAPEIKSDLPK